MNLRKCAVRDLCLPDRLYTPVTKPANRVHQPDKSTHRYSLPMSQTLSEPSPSSPQNLLCFCSGQIDDIRSFIRCQAKLCAVNRLHQFSQGCQRLRARLSANRMPDNRIKSRLFLLQHTFSRRAASIACFCSAFLYSCRCHHFLAGKISCSPDASTS